jgi:dual specificity MAP kinase phosphatase
MRPPSELGCAAHPTSSPYIDPSADPYISHDSEKPSPFNTYTNDPSHGLGFDICIECHEHAPFPSVGHLRAAEEHVRTMEVEWIEMWHRHWEQKNRRASSPPDPTIPLTSSTPVTNPLYTRPPPGTIPPRPPPHPSAIVHLPFPSSPQATTAGLNALLPVIRFLERMVTPGTLGCFTSVSPGVGSASGNGVPRTPQKAHTVPSPWSPIPESSESRSGSITPHMPALGNTSQEYPNGKSDATTQLPSTYRPRPLKVLLYSSDGYTESSVPALCLLMAVKGVSLPEAYLEMQVGLHACS